MTATDPAVPDRTWTEDHRGVQLETHDGEFSVEVVRGDRVDTVVVHGELDIATAPLLRSVLDTVHARRPRRVEVVLSDVTFMDGHGLRTLVAARRRLAARWATLVLRDPSPVVSRVLVLTGLDRTLEVAGAGRPLAC